MLKKHLIFFCAAALGARCLYERYRDRTRQETEDAKEQMQQMAKEYEDDSKKLQENLSQLKVS